VSTTIIHNGVEFDYDDALYSPPIGAVDELNQALSITPKSIRKFLASVPALQKESGLDNEEFIYTHDYINAFVGLIFLAHRRAGEPFTLEQAKAISYRDVVMRSDTTAEEEATDPKAPTTGSAAAAPATETPPTTT
jgi:hypothetical protein